MRKTATVDPVHDAGAAEVLCRMLYGRSARTRCAHPLFGDLEGLPPSLLFVGGDEVMLDDTRLLHEKLLKSGCQSRLIIAPERWHAYVLYYLNENMCTILRRSADFMTKVLSPAKKLRWMRLDNAAKIYPAAKRRDWTNYLPPLRHADGAGGSCTSCARRWM